MNTSPNPQQWMAGDPRPAGENAGPRDDAFVMKSKTDLREPSMLRRPERSRSSGGAKDLPQED